MPSKGTITLFKIAGIQVYLHWAWVVVAIYEIQRTDRYSSVLWGVLEYLTLFAIVLIHEFGHALACRSVGGRALQIVLWPLGGVAFVEAPPRPGATLWSIAAGPLVNVALVPVLAVVYLVASVGGESNFVSFLKNINFINALILIFNMLPIYPLDGGKILHSVLWYIVGRAKSLMAAVIVGFVGVGLLGVLAIILMDLRLAVLVLFAGAQCFEGYKQAQALRRLEAMPRREGVACPSCGVKPPIGVVWRCSACQAEFDTFQSGAVCPRCRATFPKTRCPDCGEGSSYDDWVAAAAAQGAARRVAYAEFEQR